MNQSVLLISSLFLNIIGTFAEDQTDVVALEKRILDLETFVDILKSSFEDAPNGIFYALKDKWDGTPSNFIITNSINAINYNFESVHDAAFPRFDVVYLYIVMAGDQPESHFEVSNSQSWLVKHYSKLC